MSRRSFLQSISGALLLANAGASLAQQPAPAPAGSDQMPAYKPPLRGAPSSRVGGGSRGAADNAFVLAVIAPDHTGLTTQDQPTLYWYLSGKVATPVEITLIDDVGIKPLLEKTLDAPAVPGVQKLALKDSSIHLQPGIEYRWHVALIVDPAQRSNDILASATIKRETPSDSVRAKLANLRGSALTVAYAEEGFWYDSLESLMVEMQGKPADAALKNQFTSLLSQVGLAHVGSAR